MLTTYSLQPTPMLDHIRRILIVIAIVFTVGAFYKHWRVQQDGFGFFDLFKGDASSANYTPPNSPALSETDVPGLSRLSEEFAKISQSVLPSVVSINTSTINRMPVRDVFGFLRGYRNGISPGLGSGVFVSKEGHVVTNYHVIKGASEIKITTNDLKTYDAEVIGTDTQLDIAVLKVKSGDKNFPPLSFSDSGKARVGQIVFAVGNPFGLSGTVTQGIISATQRRFSDSTNALIQTDTVINPGNSGGPLINIRGEIVGINVAIFRGEENVHAWQGVGLAIPASDVKTAFETIIRIGKVEPGYFGIQINPTPVAVSSSLQTSLGALVEIVIPDSPAAKAGLKPGDVITKFGDASFKSLDELLSMIQNARPGQKISITLVRDGKLNTLSALIEQQPQGK